MARRLESAFCFPFFPPSLFLFVFTSFFFRFSPPFVLHFYFPSPFSFSPPCSYLLLSPLVLFPILLFPVALLDLLSHSSFPYSGDDDLPIATKRNAVLAWQFSRSLVTLLFIPLSSFPRYIVSPTILSLHSNRVSVV